MKVLIVSEDPGFMRVATRDLRPKGMEVVGCLGPAHAKCPLEDGHECALAARSDVVLIDSPSSGIYGKRWKTVPAGAYAENLQRAHPGCTVLLCGAPEGPAGPSGEVLHTTSARGAVMMMCAVAADRPAITP